MLKRRNGSQYFRLILLFLLVLSVSVNVSLLRAKLESTPQANEVKGSYELFISDLYGILENLDSFLKVTDSKENMLHLYSAVYRANQTNLAAYKLESKSVTTYEKSVNPLPEYTQDLVFEINEIHIVFY